MKLGEEKLVYDWEEWKIVYFQQKKSFAFSSNVGCEGIKWVKMFDSNLYL